MMSSSKINAALSIITSDIPKVLTKTFELSDKEQIVKSTSGHLTKGEACTKKINSIDDLSNIIKKLKPNQALCFGVTEQSPVKLITKKEFAKTSDTSNLATRSKDHFKWPLASGIMVLDYDPRPNGEALSRDDLLSIILDEGINETNDPCFLWFPSSGSNITNTKTNSEVIGLRGQRIYLLVKDASDIPRAGRVLFERLWLAGHGYYDLSRSGGLLNRSTVDKSVWGPCRLDFAAGAECSPPLKQCRGEPFIYDGEILDTQKALPDLTTDENEKLQKLQLAARNEMKVKAAQKRDEYITEKTIEIVGKNASDEQTTIARKTVQRAIENDVLSGDFPLTLEDGQQITVAEALDNPQIYHNKQVLDPIEPEYNNGAIVGKIYLMGTYKNLHSFAHGGKNYKLFRQPRRIQVVKGETHTVVEATIAIMQEMPDWFDMGDMLISIIGDRIVPMNEDRLTHQLAGFIQYFIVKKSVNGDREELIDPPTKVVKHILAKNQDRELKPLSAIINAPVVRLDGSVLNRPTYDRSSQLLLHTTEIIPSTPRSPTIDDVRAAVETLMKPFDKFSFCTELDRAVLMASAITAALRPVLPTAPAFGFDAPVQGSGKTLLANSIGTIATGTEPTTLPHLKGEDEIRKRLLSVLRSGARTMVWDNIVGSFDSAALAAFLTSSTYEDRVLSKSETLKLPNKMLMLTTGNNMMLAGDLPRRILVCRIDPNVPRPYARRFDFCPTAYIKEHRQKLIAAIITIVQGWLCSSEYKKGEFSEGEMASFEDWDKLVRQPVSWVSSVIFGGAEFGDVMDAVNAAQSDDPEMEALTEMLSGLNEMYGTESFTTGDVFKACFDFYPQTGIIERCIRDALDELYSEIHSAKSLGKVLTIRKDRIAGGLKLIQAGKGKGGVKKFKVVSVSDKPAIEKSD
jgi:hypothetical protein